MDKLKLNTTDINKLISNNFRKISSTEFVYKIPVYKYKHSTLVTCIFTADIEEKVITLQVVDNSTDNIYSSYYNREYSKNNNVADTIDTNINKEIERLKKENIIKYDR